MDSYIIPGERVFPEGIAYEAASGRFFVGSTTTGDIFVGQGERRELELYLPGGQDGRTSVLGMKVDGQGRLFVAGGRAGNLFVYCLKDKQLLASFGTGLEGSMVNDVAVAADGAAYFTDSLVPCLYKVSPDSHGGWTLEYLDLEGTAVVYEAGINFNGIVAAPDGYLIAVQMNTGKLFRLCWDSGDVQPIMADVALTHGDGMLLLGSRLYVMRNRANELVVLELRKDWLTAKKIAAVTDERFDFTTTFACDGRRLLMVNGQLDKRQTDIPPNLPFRVIALAVPGLEMI